MKTVQHGKTDNIKILIVEDEIPLALLMVHVLSRAGCDVQFAPNGEKGLKLVHERKFDLIALEIYLPDINGFSVCREVKQRHISRKTPVVFISRSPCEEDRQRSLEAGAVDCINKPFEATDFVFRIISHAKAKGNPSDFPGQEPATGHLKSLQYAATHQ